jgi:HSP20 family protein
MNEKKRSFFGRFVKNKKTDEVPKIKVQEKENLKPKEELKEKRPQEQEIKKEMPQEEWASDYEGQLTIDVFQTANDIVIKSTIAGVTPENIDVTIDNDMVTIKGERKNETSISEENYYYQECYWGAFSRSVILPCDVEADKTRADLKNGILTVYLPKVNKAKTRKISVKAA